LAQVSGNIELSWEERWLYDVKYVSSCSLTLDAVIALKTVLVIVLGENQFVRKI
jgi:lipopolysaccharide/colanic/teichoic acid biosynthesis glycosyltransferase